MFSVTSKAYFCQFYLKIDMNIDTGDCLQEEGVVAAAYAETRHDAGARASAVDDAVVDVAATLEAKRDKVAIWTATTHSLM